MDLRIVISDENGDVFEDFSVYQDGSDSEGAKRIVQLIAGEFQVEGWFDGGTLSHEEREPKCGERICCDDPGCLEGRDDE